MNPTSTEILPTAPEIKTILSLLSPDSDAEHIYGVVVTNFAADIASRSTCPMSKQRGLYIEKGKGGWPIVLNYSFRPSKPFHLVSTQ